jgi:tRNA-specific 2-thiouridylase
MLDQAALGRTQFPVGSFASKAELRALAGRLGLRTADKPDSQDVCFITSSAGRDGFLRRRLELHPARVVDRAGVMLGEVPAVELVTIGQRKGLGLAGGGPKRYVIDVDRGAGVVVVGDERELAVAATRVGRPTWVDGPVSGDVLVQASAHGRPAPARLEADGEDVVVGWREPQRRIAPGQSVIFYDLDDRRVHGGGPALP